MLKKIRVFDVIRIIALLFFLGVLLYPSVSNYLFQMNSSKVIESYEESIYGIDDNTKKKMLLEARQYNTSLISSEVLYDPFSSDGKQDRYYNSLLSLSHDGMIGYIRIPKIDVELPIYHGTSEGVLQKGIGHLEGTSLPIGGSSTHAVLTGHRGLPSAKLFTELDMIEEGDVFYIKVLGNTLAYEVDQILTVLPHEMSALNIERGKDYVTLVTCTPYAVNTHRMLVRGHRIPYEEANHIQKDEHVGNQIPLEYIVLCLGVIILFGIVMVMRKIKR